MGLRRASPELDDDLAIQEVRAQVERSLQRNQRDLDLAGRLVQLAALTRPQRAERLWRWHIDRVGAEDGFLVTAMRIGATALLAGNASLALSVAIAVRPQDAKTWIDWFEQHDIADSEAASDQLYGYLLGADPQYALQEFARFLECASAIS